MPVMFFFEPRPDAIKYLHEVADLLEGRRIEPIKVTSLWPGHARALGAASPIVWLSSYTALKLDFKTPLAKGLAGANLELFHIIPLIIRDGECRRLDRKQLVFLWSSKSDLEKPYRAVVKVTEDRHKRVFLQSAYRIETRQIPTTLRRSTPVRRN